MRHYDPSRFTPYEKAFRPAEMLNRYAYSLCGGPCTGLFLIDGAVMLKDLIRRCIDQQIPYKILGGISNVLISDAGFDDIILLNRKGRISFEEHADGSVSLFAESGASMSSVVRFCIQNEITGVEWAAGLPGTVGGAVYGNAGAFGTEIADIFVSGHAVTDHGVPQTLRWENMEYSYRTGLLKKQKNKWTLLDAEFNLKKGQRDLIVEKGDQCREKRRLTQPVGESSLGSVFKNPDGYSAGKLIQDAGLKGMSIGKASVSRKHANFITTEPGVRSEDYRKLIFHIQKTVYEKFGIHLEPEIEMLGFEKG